MPDYNLPVADLPNVCSSYIKGADDPRPPERNSTATADRVGGNRANGHAPGPLPGAASRRITGELQRQGRDPRSGEVGDYWAKDRGDVDQHRNGRALSAPVRCAARQSRDRAA